jgi:hypothetical protein
LAVKKWDTVETKQSKGNKELKNVIYFESGISTTEKADGNKQCESLRLFA